MIQSPVDPVTLLAERLERGSRLLLDMERRGDVGPEYARWLAHWIELLREYEATQAA